MRCSPSSAVTAGVKDVRRVIDEGRARLELRGRRTVLFVDEIHRFNKGQQDALLPGVEAGWVVARRCDHREPVLRAQRPAAVPLSAAAARAAHAEDVRTLLACACTIPSADSRAGALTDDALRTWWRSPTATRARRSTRSRSPRRGHRVDAGRRCADHRCRLGCEAPMRRFRYDKAPTATTTRCRHSSSRCAAGSGCRRVLAAAHARVG
jgi:hypothetical protein